MPADKTDKYTWDVFYKGKEGFAEHIQVGADDPEALQNGRGVLMLWLQSIDAETLPRDKENQGKSYPPRAGARPPQPKAQPGVTPVCPVDGGEMTLKTGVKGPNSQNPGEPYAFFGCNNYKTTGCRGTVQA